MINVLSLFDGLGGARIALDQLGIACNYYASELDKHAIKVAKANYPDIIHVGDIQEVSGRYLPQIDLLIGGSPCQDLSVAREGRKGLKGQKSGLFWEYVRLLIECNPWCFMLENVASMKHQDRDIITKTIGVEPLLINSTLFTAQNRRRYYWTDIIAREPPQDLKITLADIVENCKGANGCAKRTRKGKKRLELRKDNKSNALTTVQTDSMIKVYTRPRGYNKGGVRETRKAPTVTSSCFEHNNFIQEAEGVRKFTPVECERLQGIPDNYTNHVSNSQRYKMIGNGFTVPVITYILKHSNLIKK